MKTLANKNNPAIRITVPEIDRVCLSTGDDAYNVFIVKQWPLNSLVFFDTDWTLVEEEPEKIYYKMLDNKANCPFDKGNCNYCTVQFCGAREENHIETRSTAEPMDLEKAAEEYAFGNLDDAALYGCTMSGRIAAFKAGAKWMAKQIKGGSK